MTSIASALALLAATCLAVWLLAARVRPRRNKGILEISPRYRSFFRQLGVTETAHFLSLPGETPHIVSGHPDRNVARITFRTDSNQWSAFLKCEHRVGWRTRISNAAAGFGFLSRSLREARTLQALEREGLPGPEWLAAGEDDRGHAFLLVREAPGMELRAVLAAEKEPRRRRRIARRLGITLARLHTAGFHHPDLYANHLFLDCDNDSIRLLDWQRACLQRTLSWRKRRRGLAALHATVDAALTSAEERLLFLRAYWRSSSPLGVSWRAAVREIELQTRRLLARRHVREKRQHPAPPQAWICLADDALCVTPVMLQRCGERLPDYFPLLGEERSSVPSQRRRWPVLPDGARARLAQRNQPKTIAEMWPSSRRSAVSTEQHQAALLLRLQRHGIAAPQVLALGRRRTDDGRMESFLLTEPIADTCSLEAWLSYRTRRRTKAAEPSRCWSVLHQAGALLRSLHDASCYLDFDIAGCGLAVRQAGRNLAVVLDNVDGVIPRRRRHPRRTARDLRRMQQMLRFAGCGRDELDRFRTGYFDGTTEVKIDTKAVSDASQKRSPRRSAEASLTGLVFPCSGRDSLWRRLLLGVRRCWQRPDWPRFAGADWANRIMDLAVTDRFHAKQGRSTGRWIITNPAEDRTQRLSVYLKRHYDLPRWRGWLATFWPRWNWSPACQEWRQLEWAGRQGLPVPRAVAAAEYVGPWGKLQSFLAVEELSGMLSLHQAIPLAAVRQDARSFRHWKRSLAAEMARLTRVLHDRRCFHKDLYLCHFFIAEQDTRGVPAAGWRGRLHLIDLHRLNHHPLMWRIWQTKDLAELLYSSSIIGLDARDRLAFWRAYRGDGPHRSRFTWTRFFILYRWRRYCRHNARDQQTRRDELAWT